MSWNEQGGGAGSGGSAGGAGGGFGPPPQSFGPPPSFGPPSYGPPPMPPTTPPAPREPADPLRAVAVGLLNLSGLGLGYLATRRWIALAVALIGTGIFLFSALPADPDGVSGGVLVTYPVFLGLTAVHGALRGLRTRLSFPPQAPLALLLGLVLLAVPAASVVYYKGAKDDATEKMLLDRLDKADKQVQAAKNKSFSAAKADYDHALGSYRDLDSNHKDSKAAKQVPDRMQTFYTTVGAPYDKKQYCLAIDPLKYLRTVPKHIDSNALGKLAGWPDDKLADSLYQCGLPEITDESVDVPTDGGKLSELLDTFPKSTQAAKVEPALKAQIDAAGKKTSGGDPCAANVRLRSLSDEASNLSGDKAGISDALTADRHRVDGYLETGSYNCAVAEYKDASFDDALDDLNKFIDAYPHNKNTPTAKKIAIAAEIATKVPAAGKKLPTNASGGSISVTFTNDSPDSVEILYTGKVTGSFTLKGCGKCTRYMSDSLANSLACKDSSMHYDKHTLHLPAGTSYVMQKPLDDDDSAEPVADSHEFRGGYIYTECAYVVESSYGF